MLQIAGGVSVLLNAGEGLTLTVTFWVVEQPFALIVKTYTTLIGLTVVLINTSFGLALWAVVIAGLLIPATAALVQVNEAPEVRLVGV